MLQSWSKVHIPPEVLPIKQEHLAFSSLHTSIHSVQVAWQAELLDFTWSKHLISSINPELFFCVHEIQLKKALLYINFNMFGNNDEI